VAATGLLGINPYFKGVKIDTSKPVNLAIQLQQKEQAKKEALDKSFMDYEKSINPAGMRKQEGDVFLKKFAENKAFYLQNRDKILNPARYGYDAQSQYMANNKSLLSLIDQSKQAAANDKVAQQHFMAQKGLNAPDGYKTALELSRLPVTDPNYKPLDITQYKFYENLDPIKYGNKVYSKIKLSEEAPEFIEMKEKPGYYYTKTKSKVSPEYRNIILQEGYANYANDEGLRKGINEIFDTNKAEVKRLEEKYSTKIPNAQALAGIYTWDLQPMKEVTSDIKPTKDLEFQNWLKRFNLTQGAKKVQPVRMENIFDKTGSGGVPLKIGTDYEIVAGKVLDKDGNPATVNFKDVSGEKLPPDLYSVLEKYGIDLRKKDKYKMVAKDGKIQSITDSKGTVITRETIMSAQKKFDTERKGEEPLFVEEEDIEVSAPVKSNKFKLSATGANGVKIFSNDGVNWVDKNGKKIK
jgi:hypothetical protein